MLSYLGWRCRYARGGRVRFGGQLIRELIQEVGFQTSIGDQHPITRMNSGRIYIPGCDLSAGSHYRISRFRRANLDRCLEIGTLVVIERLIPRRDKALQHWQPATH